MRANYYEREATLTLWHSEGPKLHRDLAFLSAISCHLVANYLFTLAILDKNWKRCCVLPVSIFSQSRA